MSNPSSRANATGTLSSFDPPRRGEKLTAAHAVKFDQADLEQVMSLYAEISGRSVIRGTSLPAVKVTFSNQAPMRSVEVLQALDTVLAAQGITTVFLGTQYIKFCVPREATTEPAPVVNLPADQLPDSSSFLTYMVKLKHIAPSRAAPLLQPFAKLASSIMPVAQGNTNLVATKAALLNPPKGGMLILRDYSCNVRRMLEVLEKLEAQESP